MISIQTQQQKTLLESSSKNPQLLWWYLVNKQLNWSFFVNLITLSIHLRIYMDEEVFFSLIDSLFLQLVRCFEKFLVHSFQSRDGQTVKLAALTGALLVWRHFHWPVCSDSHSSVSQWPALEARNAGTDTMNSRCDGYHETAAVNNTCVGVCDSLAAKLSYLFRQEPHSLFLSLWRWLDRTR